MKINEIVCESNVKFPGKTGRLHARLLDIADITIKKRSNGIEYPSVKLKNNLPAGYDKAGIYVWSHPQFGIFYIGLNAAAKAKKGLNQRAESHVRKLLNRLYKESEYTVAWEKFSNMLVKHSKEDINKFRDDLDQVQITYFPLADIQDYEKQGLNQRDMYHDIERIEHKAIRRLNPYANKEYHKPENIGKKSVTRLPEPEQTN